MVSPSFCCCGMWSFRIIVLLCTVSVTSELTFEYRIRCPDTPEKWRENSESYICDGDSVYHCMQDRAGRYVVFCASSIWIQPDYCPEFNSRASAIDVILCPGDPESCPETVYLSNAVYQFPSCYRPETSFRTSTPSPTPAKTTHWNPNTSLNATQDQQVRSENDGSEKVVILVLLGIFVPVISILLVYLYCKYTKQRKDTATAALKSKPYSQQSIMEEQHVLLEPEGGRYIVKGESVKDEETINRDNEHIPEVANSEVSFHEPKDYKMVVDTLEKEDIVLLLGKSGSGKTTIANHLAKTEFQEYKTTYMKPKETNVPKVNEEKTLILWDDCLGVWNVTNRIDNEIFRTLEQLIQQVKDNSDKMKAIVCIDSSSVEENQLNELADCVGQTNLDKYYETQWEKECLRNFLDLKIRIGRVSTDVGFPLLMYLINEKFCVQESTSRFLGEPVAYIRDDIDSIFKEQRDDYVALIYTIRNSSKIDPKKINMKLWGEIQKECLRIVHKKTKEYSTNDKEAKENTLGETDDVYPDYDGNVNNDSKGHRGDVGFEKDSGQNGKSNNRISFVERILEKSNSTRQAIEINKHLAKYLVKSDESSEYKFRHQLFAQCTLRYHIEHVGKETILMKGPDELRLAVAHLHSEIDLNVSGATK